MDWGTRRATEPKKSEQSAVCFIFIFSSVEGYAGRHCQLKKQFSRNGRVEHNSRNHRGLGPPRLSTSFVAPPEMRD